MRLRARGLLQKHSEDVRPQTAARVRPRLCEARASRQQDLRSAVHVDMLTPHQRNYSRWSDAVEFKASAEIVEHEAEFFEAWCEEQVGLIENTGGRRC